MKHKYTIKDIKKLNAEAGLFFFSPDTMKFFESKIESELSDQGYFITSEKKCFNDYTRVYKVRQATNELINGKVVFSGDIKNISEWFEDISDAETLIKQLEKTK